MTDFQQELIAIIFDKFLLGLVAAGIGFYLARLLENYKNEKSYELFVWQQRVDACRSASKIITEHYFSITDAFGALMSAAEKGTFSLEDENGKRLVSYIEKQPRLRNELTVLTPFMVPHVAEAAMSYLNESGRIVDLIKGNFEQGVPTEDELLMAHTKFQVACAEVIDAGPKGLSQDSQN
ncbi:MAG: hypothetical protein AB2722_18275 [Candidatus Thiodiazotropha sp.]